MSSAEEANAESLTTIPDEVASDISADIIPEEEYEAELRREYVEDVTSPTNTSLYSAIQSPAAVQSTGSVAFVLDSIVDSVKDELSISVESSVTALDRAPHFVAFLKTMSAYGAVKRLNNFLHKKMADYFKKRKMEHVLLEMAMTDDAQARYRRKLASFNVRREKDAAMKDSITEELTSMKELRNQQARDADRNFMRLVEREGEVGVGLIVGKTGKVLPEKVIAKLIQNQVSKTKELQHLRLIHIKIRNAIADVTASIQALDNVGEDHTLVEYEQLKIENQGYVDKMEERDEELSRLRRNCRGSIHRLAHIKEKCAAIEQNIRGIHVMLEDRQLAKKAVREQMNRLKQERDWYRLETQRLKQDHGMLTNDKLLIDMESAMKSIESLAQANQARRERLLVDKERVHNLKLHYEHEMRKRSLRKQDTERGVIVN